MSGSARPDGPSIAVVGSGLAGLAATWMLGRSTRVTVFEAAERAGIGAHSIRLGPPGQDALVDVPLRVFTSAYYPTLLALYRAAGIGVVPVDYATSFTHLDGATYFRYRNVRIAGRSLPWLAPRDLAGAEARAITRDLVRLHRVGPTHLAEGRAKGCTLQSYLEDEGFSEPFVEGFVLPAYATVCTCTVERVRRYPADVVIRYLCSGVTTRGVMRSVGGSQDVAMRLLRRAAEVRFGSPVERVVARPDHALVVRDRGEAERFDHVVLATRADQAVDLLEGDDTVSGLLDRVPHEPSRVVVHSDPALAPADRSSWRPVNVFRSAAHGAPMATIWMNRVQPDLGDGPPTFQTWNPLVEPDPDTVVADAAVARPVVTLDTHDLPQTLSDLCDDPDRRVWPIGSYAASGIPLLEAAASSALRVARRIEAILPLHHSLA